VPKVELKQAAPVAPAPRLPLPPAVQPDPSQPEAGWHWCEDCYVVSGQPGECPSCTKPFLPVTTPHLPYGPYTPKSAAVIRSAFQWLSSFFAILLLLVPIAVGVFLFRAGQAPGTPGAFDPAGVHTTVNIPGLGNVKIPGQFVSDSTIETSLISNYASQKGVVKVAMINGTTVFGVIILPPASAPPTPTSAPSGQKAKPTPAQAQNVGDTATQTDGTKIAIEDQVALTIGGYPAVRGDTAITNSKTGVVTTVRKYDIGLPNEQILIDIETSANPSPLGLFEQALLALPKSVGPQQ
jgi:hypothetical protein